MLTITASIALGLAFVLIGGINVWLVLEAWSHVKASNASSRMLTLHRIGGYVFIALFCVMSYFMAARLRGGADVSAGVSIHLALAMILSPLLFIKVLIARYYKNQHGLLMPIGLAIFVLAFVLVASTAGPYLARTSRMEQVSVDPGRVPPVPVDLSQASELMQKRCAKCHNLDRVVGARKDAQGWMSTVKRMQALPSAGISDSEVNQIVSYLVSQNPVGGARNAQPSAVARALVDQRCGRCHGLDRVYKTIQTPDYWRETVNRMVDYAAGSAGALQPGEDRKITDYLAATQTPEAAEQKRAEEAAAASEGRSLIADKPQPNPPTAPASQGNGRTIGFVSLICLAAVALVVRRPGARPSAPVAPAPKIAMPVAARKDSGAFLLQLVQITPQNGDAKTLRFAVRGDRKLDALPGQFLTFNFLFDGKKETRCYSICSSPARTGYVEITPKKATNGNVSVFLNERAAIGMTVEATGPFGQFCLNPPVERRVVLIAAGSGITPMMGMLRYLDDLCLNTEATLLYCVRTKGDILFRQELEDLQARLANFRYQVALSRPDPEWTGARGHIGKQWLREVVPDLAGRVFFLCGPPPFMEVARSILRECGVEAESIRQETFGGAGADIKPRVHADEGVVSVEFARSGTKCSIAAGQTLLEAAMENGVPIPSACRQGQCGTCKTRLLEGEVAMSAEQGLDAESKARGFVLTCVGRPVGPVRLDA